MEVHERMKAILVHQLLYLHFDNNVITILLDCKTEQRDIQREFRRSMRHTRGWFCIYTAGVARRLSQLTSNKITDWSVLHVEVSLVTNVVVDHIFVGHEILNGCKNSRVI